MSNEIEPKKVLLSDKTLGKIVERLVGTFYPERIYLFGSKARGDSNEHSDYDLLVVLAEMTEPGYRYSKRAHRALWGLGIDASVDVAFLSLSDFERKKSIVGSLAEMVQSEGKELYAA